MTDVNAITDNETVFNTLYLLESFILSSHFKQPTAIHYQISLVRHRKLFRQYKAMGYYDINWFMRDLEREAIYFTPRRFGNDAIDEQERKARLKEWYKRCDEQRKK